MGSVACSTMLLDHIVLRSPHRETLVSDLAKRARLSVLDGFKESGQVRSQGLRFANGPFLDVFDWPADKPAFSPLLALEGDIDRSEAIAKRNGWVCNRMFRNAFPPQDRPPWSMLSFGRGQGVVSSIFIIEYETDAQAWSVENFAGDLYKRSRQAEAGADLCGITIQCDDLSLAQTQMDALAQEPIPFLTLTEATDPGPPISLQFRFNDELAHEWSPVAQQTN